ncbi:hypothetical protein [Denitratimonas sp. CY0512]|uniref:hypothetical protein n=1 Tax=Denitratimonas sp. CY0512 TaxID=3131940 RepID=UPI0030A607D6
MLGSLTSLAGYLLVLFVITVWMCVKIWRRSPLLAIGAFFLWPLSLIALFLYWGDEDSDIRVPFALSLVVSILIGVMAMRAVDKGIDEMAWMLSDEDIAQIRLEDPKLADQLEEARRRLDAEYDEYDDGEYDDSDAIDPPPRSGSSSARQPSATPAPAAVETEVDPVQAEIQHRLELAQAVHLLSWRFGIVDLAPAAAKLRLPQDFRFVPRNHALRVARLRGTPLDNDVIGWVVHRQVDLARDDAWYVQMRYVPLETRLRAPTLARLDKAEISTEISHHAGRIAQALQGDRRRRAEAATWDPETGIATWQWPADEQESAHRDHIAALPVGNGLLEFSVPAVHQVHAELGERAARLMAARTTVTAP